MISVLCALTLVLGQEKPATDLEEKPESPWVFQIHVSTRTPQLYDPVFMKVEVFNTRKELVELPVTIFSQTTHALRTSRPGYSFEFEAEEPPARTSPLGSSAKHRTTSLKALQFPPLGHASKHFWRDLIGRGCTLETRLFLPSEKIASLRRPFEYPFQYTLEVRERPAEEMTFLDRLFADAWAERNNVQAKNDPQLYRPHHFRFGLEFPTNVELTDRLLAYEDHLSPGTLRNIVHLTSLTRKLYDSPREDDRLVIVDEIIHWLDALGPREPGLTQAMRDVWGQVEREFFANAITEWMYGHHPDEHAYHKLFYECTERLPASYRQYEDYREFTRSAHTVAKLPGYKEYFAEREAERQAE